MMTQLIQQNQTKSPFLSLRNDAVLKLYFGKEENKEQLRQFLKATTHLTDDDLAHIHVKNATLTKQHVFEKDFIVDIHLTSVTGHHIIIEMQIQNHVNFIERIVSYNARRYASQLKPGESYIQLKEVITIIITDFTLFNDSDDFSEHILFRRENRKIFTNAQQFYIIDLTKLPYQLTEAKHHWGALFKAKSKEELNMLMQQSNTMKQAGEKLLDLNSDEEAREIAMARQYSQMAYRDELHAREQKGIEQGIQQGIKHTIGIMKELGIDDQLISNKLQEKFQLTRQEVEKYLHHSE